MIAVLLLAGALATADGTASSRLAVLPFKNLNAEPSLEWLKVGVAETMIADLKSAKRDVVERDQIDRALAELALQGASLSEDSRAAQAGRIVGATHVVVGGVQRANRQVRITARLVVVETGVVDASAKVTGDLDDIFGLQDALVGQLLKLPDPKRRPKPKQPAQTLAAYQAYARALSTSSDVEKVEELKRALDLDPEFHYALADLRALEARLDRYAKQSRALSDERTQKQLAVVLDTKATVDDRNMQAIQLMGTLMQQFRYQELLDVAMRIEALDLPAGQWMSAKETAAYYVYLALTQLKRGDLALQAGERALQKYPGGTYAQALQMQLRSQIEQAHRNEDDVKRAGRDLERIAFEERELEREAAKRGEPPSGVRVRSLAFQRCSVVTGGQRWADSLEQCGAFVAGYGKADDTDDLVKIARWNIARAHAELGRFDRARAETQKLLDEHPEWARRMSLATVSGTWPR